MSEGGATSPYVGLRPYTESESAIFFGRERERRVVSSNLIASRLTLLFGPSGVGKSSALNAAVVPHLRGMASDQADEQGRPGFAVVTFNSWRDDPVAGLVERLRFTAESLGVPGAVFDDPNAPLAAALRTWTERTGTDVLVILDQFEEYFLYQGRDGRDDRFGREFPEAVNDPTLRANFLVSFREDALAELDRFKGRIPKLFANYLRIAYLDRTGARQAIVGPVAEYNRTNPDHRVEIEPQLVDEILAQVEAGKVVVGQAGAGTVDGHPTQNSHTAIETSHLQIVMARLWDEEISGGSRVLRASTLARLGGADAIIRRHLDRVLELLSAEEHDIAAAAFEHLVTPSGTKIAHSRADLAILARVPEADLARVLDRLSSGGSRILRPVEPAPGRSEPRYEIFHDVLAPAIVDWRARWVQQQERKAAEEELRRQREEAEERARAARRRARNLSIFSLALALLVIALVVAAVARHQRDLARSRERAAAAMAALSVDPVDSVRGALDALDTAYTREAETALRRALAASHLQWVFRGHKDWVNAVRFDAAGTSVVTAASDGTARIWDVASGRERVVLDGHRNQVVDAGFDPAGRVVVTSSTDGTVRLWDAASGQPGGVLAPVPRKLLTAAFDPSGSRVVTAGEDGVVLLWDAASGQPLRELTGQTGQLTGATFDSTGTRVVASGSDGSVVVWDATNGQPLGRFTEHRGRVNRAVFSPDGRLVATAGDNGLTYLWRWQSGEAILLPGHSEDVVSVAFDRFGGRLVTAGDKTARVWDSTTGAPLAVLEGHSDALTAAVFDSDGGRVATSAQDGAARVWDVATASTLVELRGHAEIVWDVAFSADDQSVATAGSDGTARVWALPSQRTLQHADWVLGAEFSTDGKSVLTSGNDGVVRIWNAASGDQEAELSGHEGQVVAAFNRDATLVATLDEAKARVWPAQAGAAPVAETTAVHRGLVRFLPAGDGIVLTDEDGTVYRWDWREGRPPERLTGYRGGITVTDLDVSPDGSQIVTAGSDRVARVWDIAARTERATLRGHDGVLYSARFSADGRLVVTSSADGTARIWRTGDGEQVRELTAEGGLRSASFDRSGTRVVGGGVDGTIRIWDARTGRTLAVLPRHTEAVNSARVSPDGRLILSASDDRTAAMYECAECEDLAALRARAEQYVERVKEPALATVREWALSPGDCFDDAGNGYARIVDCDSAHEMEVFAVMDYPAGPEVAFDQGQVGAYAQERCSGRLFTDYVGVPLSKSTYHVAYWAPNEGTWKESDRRITCTLHGTGKTSGSARGAEE